MDESLAAAVFTLDPKKRLIRPTPVPKRAAVSEEGLAPSDSWALVGPADVKTRRSVQSTRPLTPLQQRAQDQWLFESLGRLQTAVVDYVLASFAGCSFSDDQQKGTHPSGRQIRSAPGTCSAPARNPPSRQVSTAQDSDAPRPSSASGPRTLRADSNGFERLPEYGRYCNPFLSKRAPSRLSTPSTLFYAVGPDSRSCVPRRTRSSSLDHLNSHSQHAGVHPAYHGHDRPASAPGTLETETFSYNTLHAHILNRVPRRRRSSRRALQRTDSVRSNPSQLGQIPEHAAIPNEQSHDESRPEQSFNAASVTSANASPSHSAADMSRSSSLRRRTSLKSRRPPPVEPLHLPESIEMPSGRSFCGERESCNPFESKYSAWTPTATSLSEGNSARSSWNYQSSLTSHTEHSFDSPASLHQSPWGSPTREAQASLDIDKVTASIRRTIDEKAAKALGANLKGSQETLRPPAHASTGCDEVLTPVNDGKTLSKDMMPSLEIAAWRLPSPNRGIDELSSLSEEIAARFGLGNSTEKSNVSTNEWL